MKRVINLTLASVMLMSLSSCGRSTETQLFNGKDFTGFEPLGGRALFEVEDGMLVGTSTAKQPNSFMATTEDYSDFILEYEVKNDTLLNSGVQIRSHSYADYKDGKVHGYQVEIDPSDRAWSGGIFEEGVRGWLQTLDNNEAGRKAYKKDDWNHYRVEALGNNIRVWLNGVATANLYDDRESSGFIAFQVHAAGGPKLGKKTYWRNITIDTVDVEKKRLKGELAPPVNKIPNTLTEDEIADGWKLLFDGKSLDQWETANGKAVPAGWVIKDGYTYIDRETKPRLPGGSIVTKDEYSAFELSLEFKLTEHANSGIKYFVKSAINPENGKNVVYGLEYQLMDDARYAGWKNMDAHKLAALYDLIPLAKKRYSGVDTWNNAVIKVYPDNRVEHWLNGFKVIEYVRGSEEYRALVAKSKYKAPMYNVGEPFGEVERGKIQLQDHGDVAYFRNIKIRELK